MKKPDEEISGVYAGLSDTDVTLFGKAVEFEKVLAEMSERLHYSQNVFVLGSVLGAGESGAIVVKVWHDNFMMDVRVPEETPAAFAKAFEDELKKYDQYRERFEQVESDTSGNGP